ncbi:MAG TPA: hypothetical protein VLL97_06095, partial [Acidobacteriota bacterium]|nr:hypothetical protein [Acidobacteriota bacterium]
MMAPSILNISRMLLVFAMLVTAVAILPLKAQAQAEEAEAREYTEEEYQKWQKFQSATDNAEKMDLVVKFFTEHPKSQLRDHILTEYQNMMFNLQNQQNWPELIAHGQRFLAVVPNDEYTVSSLAAAYAQMNDYSGFVTFAEKVYKSSPSPQLAYGIAMAYLNMENEARFFQWGERALAGDPGKFDLAVEMTRRYLAREN